MAFAATILLRSTSSWRRQNWTFFSWKGVRVWIAELRRDYRLGHAFGFQLLGELLALLVAEVEEPLQDKHAEDDFLVLRASILPRRSSQAWNKRLESWLRVNLVVACVFSVVLKARGADRCL